jgi:hypothetical protein
MTTEAPSHGDRVFDDQTISNGPAINKGVDHLANDCRFALQSLKFHPPAP